MLYFPQNNRSRLELPKARLVVALALAFFIDFVKAEPEEVVVVGTALNKLVTHVSGIVSVNRDNQIARWNSSLCLRIEGLPSQQQRILRDRVADASSKVRISVLDEGCAENVLLFFASDAGRVSQQLARHYEIPLRQDSNVRVQDFMESPAPVRWINTYDRCGFGCRLANSRITASSAPAVDFMLIVVDVTQAQGRYFQDIADYVAFVILANPSPQSKPAVESVLRLFDTAPKAATMGGISIYDQVYLDALYSVPMDRYIDGQRNAISSLMLTQLNSLQQ